ncbi:hypothetical protein K438DRAFT_556107 [Mycena galopus ATCC 62051]|nr:hypothetical protein K438DRAFT_556107 [Mycena galopus ATCC 62051]
MITVYGGPRKNIRAQSSDLCTNSSHRKHLQLAILCEMANSVTQLNNYFQGTKASHTVSWVEYSSGPSHAIKWTVECKVSGEVKGTGVADSKAAAKEEAARLALEALGV